MGWWILPESPGEFDSGSLFFTAEEQHTLRDLFCNLGQDRDGDNVNSSRGSLTSDKGWRAELILILNSPKLREIVEISAAAPPGSCTHGQMDRKQFPLHLVKLSCSKGSE